MPEMTTKFLNQIKQKQANLELSNQAFASYIGVSRQMWEWTIHPTRPIPLGPTVAHAAMARFPDLHDLFMSWVQEYKKYRAPKANAVAERAATASAVADSSHSLVEVTR